MWAKFACFLILGVFLKLVLELGTLLTLLAVFAVYLATGGWKFAYVVVKTFKRDCK
jgi:hypothetical protein